jgi:Holliday junction resolvase RusA-like endonuclease
MAHAHVYEDDSQIADLRIRRGGVDRDNPRLEIILEAA